MNFAQFFIHRPIFAAVLSISWCWSAASRCSTCPSRSIRKSCRRPSWCGPSIRAPIPKVLAETVATPIEQEINGVENMLYMSSTATSDGVMTLTVTFKLGTDLDKAQVQVQNRVSIAPPKLPEDVRRLGVTTTKQSPDLTMVVHLVSPDDSRDELYLGNYAFLHVKDELARLPGVGEVQVFGARDYSMRVWLDPDKLAARNMTAGDVVRAIREQNVQVAAGVIGAAARARRAGDFQLTVNTQGRLIDEEQFDEHHHQDRAHGARSRG